MGVDQAAFVFPGAADRVPGFLIVREARKERFLKLREKFRIHAVDAVRLKGLHAFERPFGISAVDPVERALQVARNEDVH